MSLGIVFGVSAGEALAQDARAGSAIDASLRAAVERKDVPGVVALVTDRQRVLYQGAFGVADVASGRPLTADALFRIASMTKAVTSLAAMQLVEQGRMALDDPTDKYLPEMANLKVIESFNPATGEYKLRPAARSPTVRQCPDPHVRAGVSLHQRDLARFQAARRRDNSRSAGRCCSIRASAGTTAPAPTWSASWSKKSPGRSSKIISASTSSCRSR